MSASRPLRGACSCGRNEYQIQPPTASWQAAQVLFDSSSAHHRRSQAAPLSAFLRIPLSWYHSQTHAYYPDETHPAIRRSYTSGTQPHAIRHFCGYCGTPLTYWTEQPPAEADYISLTLGSLRGEDLRELEDWGLLRALLDEDEGRKEAAEEEELAAVAVVYAGLPWFDRLLDGSRLGQLMLRHRERERRAGEVAGHAPRHEGGFAGPGPGPVETAVRVEWEIVEWTEGGEPAEGEMGGGGSGSGSGSGSGNGNGGKRKIGEMEGAGSRATGAAQHPTQTTTTTTTATAPSAAMDTTGATTAGEDVEMREE
ncbi:MAG: hypothetical protein M1826_000363 [Phylliscum demangeonii]|nr:MAG: hypothetical protein M1826_000363 [Phylliscum demangeonii]